MPDHYPICIHASARKPFPSSRLPRPSILRYPVSSAAGAASHPIAKKPMAQEEEVLGKAYDSRLMARLLKYLRPYRWQVAIALVSIVLKSFADVLGPYLTKVAIDRYLAPKAQRDFFRHLELAQPARHHRHRADRGDLCRTAGLQLPARVPANLLHAVDRPESDVRSAPPDLPPSAAPARRLLRQESRSAAWSRASPPTWTP